MRNLALPAMSFAFLLGCSAQSSAPQAAHFASGSTPQVVQKQPLDMGWATQRVMHQPSSPVTDGKKIYFLQNVTTPPLMSISMKLNTVTISGCNMGGGNAFSLVYGPDGNLWVGGNGFMARCTPSGVETDYQIPGGGAPFYSTVGPDGAIWFTLGNPSKCDVGRVTMSGAVTLYPVQCNTLNQIATGPDGDLWIADQEFGPAQIHKMTTAGVDTVYQAPTNCGAIWISTGPDGAMYFSANGITFGRITTSGAASCITPPEVGEVGQISLGPGGALWLAIGTGRGPDANGVQIYYPSTNSYGPYIVAPDAGCCPAQITGMTAGPDRNLWITSLQNRSVGGYVMAYVRLAMTATPSSLTIPAPGQTGHVSLTEKAYKGTWAAFSSDASVAVVSQPSRGDFVVLGVGAGACQLNISDSVDNIIQVPVLVQ
jgi:streptogramin lyase